MAASPPKSKKKKKSKSKQSFQKMVTAEFYALRELRLHQICEDLGVADERRMALQNVDVFSAVIFTALPGRFAPSSNEVF